MRECKGSEEGVRLLCSGWPGSATEWHESQGKLEPGRGEARSPGHWSS